ncbi:hypothetical protein [Pseudaquabacterium rugosum]|uniref:Uncharacterized protein n=1 Tax=Pseudaquabacterium rugosum TaxID=2984194 RepID=A0ABU9B7L6_9BURK
MNLMGLLSNNLDLSSPDPAAANKAAQTQGLLTLAAGLLQPGSLSSAAASALPQALQAYNGAQQQIRGRQLDALQMQQARVGLEKSQLDLADAQRSRERLKQVDALASQFVRSPQQQAMAASGGPTAAAAQASSTAAPGYDFQGYAQALAGLDPAKALALQQSLAKDDTPVALGDGGMLVTRTGRVLAQNPKDGAAKVSDLGRLIQEMQALSPDSPMRPAYLDAIRKASTHQPAASQSVTVSGDKSFAEVFAKNAATRLADSAEAARAAASSVQTIDRAIGVLDGGRVLTGPGSTAVTVLAQLGQQMGVTGKDTADVLSRTRQLMQTSASLAVDGAKALAGQGQITDAERSLISRVSGGEIDRLTAPEIRAVLGALRKVNVAKVQAHQQELAKVPQQFREFAPIYRVDMPAGAPPSISNW